MTKTKPKNIKNKSKLKIIINTIIVFILNIQIKT